MNSMRAVSLPDKEESAGFVGAKVLLNGKEQVGEVVSLVEKLPNGRMSLLIQLDAGQESRIREEIERLKLEEKEARLRFESAVSARAAEPKLN